MKWQCQFADGKIELMYGITYIHFYIFQRGFETLKLQYFKFLRVLPLSDPRQTSKMELFVEIN